MEAKQLEENKNEDMMRLAVRNMEQRLTKIAEGGGKKNIEKIRQKGKLTPRERIEYLIDKGSEFIEIGAFAGFEMYKEY
ncbi:MAG TPA: acyl-CoA carboxylase subunit beta, partial [Chitinophagaceae bacterium]